MATRISKLAANVKTLVLTGKGINNPSKPNILKLSINSVHFTGSGDGSVLIMLEAEDKAKGSTRTITLLSNMILYSGMVQSVLPNTMNFTDSYNIFVTSTSNTTCILDFNLSSDASFVADFKSNNES